MHRRLMPFAILLPLLALLSSLTLWTIAAPAPAGAWRTIDYGPIVDRRAFTRSGESVGQVLDRLGGQAAGPGERALLEPVLEPYGFVLADAVAETADDGADGPWIELGWHWHPGEAQPAFVELLRSRQIVVESDGRGAVRAFLPWRPPAGGTPAGTTSVDAGRAAYDEAFPVLRHVLLAERRRLAGAGASPPALRLAVYPFVHRPARTEFLLGTAAWTVEDPDLRPRGVRPPLDLAAWETFLAEGLQLEGARLEQGGRIRLLGSRGERPPTLLGRPLALADLAAAYRAVFHGGAGAPFMSLDRSLQPHTSRVNYGGRLRDTAVGLVTLLCDIRFKTFSQGIDPFTGTDQRARIREELPEFRTHLERFAAAPATADLRSQQTRFWFYPDTVDLTLSVQGDVLVIRRGRMAAASERMSAGAGGAGVPPWTQATVTAINESYDALAELYPELADLDQVVRLLAFFSWLEQLESSGAPLPELSDLLAVELPAVPTPRSFPQLLAFNALPGAGGEGRVVVHEQSEVGAALDRLEPVGGRPLTPRARVERAMQALDRTKPEHEALARRIEALDLAALDAAALDELAYAAERLVMHRLVLSTLDAEQQAPLVARAEAGEPMRVFSVGIGGLDLDLSGAVQRARAEQRALRWGAGSGSRPAPRPAATSGPDPAERTAPQARWREEPSGLGEPAVPARRRLLVERGEGRIGEQPVRWSLAVAAPHGPDPESRRVLRGAGGELLAIERLRDGRRIAYRFERASGRVTARPLAGDLAAAVAALDAAPPPAAPGMPAPGGPTFLRLLDEDAGPASATVAAELQPPGRPPLRTALPRPVLRRLVRGPAVDLERGQPIPGLVPAAGPLASARPLMIAAGPVQRIAPWRRQAPPQPGEQDPVRLARALGAWWSRGAQPAPPVVIAVDPAVSPARWSTAPAAVDRALLLLPDDAFPPPSDAVATQLRRGWPEQAGSAVSGLTAAAKDLPPLVVLVSAEAPALLGERLVELAADRRLEGRLLAVVPLGGALRGDLPARLLRDGVLAGVGVAEYRPDGIGRVGRELTALAAEITAEGPGRRVETLDGPFAWFF
jgi:hypothetical protein